ncbi:MAG: hypothetical protein J7K54_03365 [Candidatus Aenigmarchaeota archaeon]|nr:hypothetical protein [Candidatus Aenigmarchaeota archaeon]
MPVWTCPKCGEKVENFAWGEAPWKTHKCNGNAGNFELPDIREEHEKGSYEAPRQKKGNLLDFF